MQSREGPKQRPNLSDQALPGRGSSEEEEEGKVVLTDGQGPALRPNLSQDA
jgi:hypothetical protein